MQPLSRKADGIPAINVRDLCVHYGEHTVLRHLTLRVERGEIYAVLGGNGAGKSTLVGTLLGLIAPAEGHLLVMGHDVRLAADRARCQLAYVPESVALYEHLDAIENLQYLLTLAGTADLSSATIEQALSDVGLPQEAWRRRLAGYSKGMRQKVAIALAVARKTPVLLLDEPTSGLDPKATAEFNRLLHRLRKHGITTLMVTHDLFGAAEIADRVGFLREGRIDAELSARKEGGLDVQQLHAHYSRTEARA
jgi:ABC-2 type transport system ATP-binding protein